MTDLQNELYMTITDTYSKDGSHLRSVTTTSSGRVIHEDGRIPSKDVVFFGAEKRGMWEDYWAMVKDRGITKSQGKTGTITCQQVDVRGEKI